MLRASIKGLLAHKMRLAMTALSVVLGVAFVAGSFVFTDTIDATFDSLFSDVYAGVDATIRPDTDNPGSGEPSIEESLLADILAVEGVDAAAGSVAGYAQMIDSEGVPIGGQGPPTLGFSWVDLPAVNSLRIAPENGRSPQAPGEVVIDVATSEANALSVGDLIDVQTENGLGEYEIVGLANFGTEDNLAGATLTVFTLDEAQRVFGLDGQFSSIDVVASPGVDQADLLASLTSAVPSDLEVVSGEQQTQEALDDINEGLGFLGAALLAFAGVAVFVGAFVIQNTFRITVAQRTRELALLRAIGATGRQVTLSVLFEALVIGVFASALGVLAGVGVAGLIKAGMNSVGFGLPEGPLTLEPRTIIVSMLVGVVVTSVAAVLPALKAARIPPVAAMAAPAARIGRRPLRTRAIVGTIVTALGAGLMALGLIVENGSSLAMVGIGAVGVFLGMATLAPFVAVPFSRLISLPFRGITGDLARGNTARQPRRTASTASALMVGVALVAFVSIFAASVKASVTDTLDGAFPADLAFASTNFSVGVSPLALDAVSDLEEVEVVSAVRTGLVTIDDVEMNVVGVEPGTVGAVYNAEPSIPIEDLGSGLLVQSGVLEANSWAVGDQLAIDYPSGEIVDTTIVGTYEDQTFANLMISDVTFLTHVGDDIAIGFADLAAGVSLDEGVEAVDQALTEFPYIDVNTKSDQVAEAEAAVDQLVALFSGLLGLALVIAVLGIANTLALSIVERTSEIGLLRAVGMHRRQVRKMIRREAVITAVFGAVLGLVIGTTIGFGVISSLEGNGLQTFAIPAGQLVIWLVVAALAGVLAAVGPARKASRLDVLKAISYE
ncbi:MAG TPA: FtsX-like permease family protein [Acidimicrobiia bacterium]